MITTLRQTFGPLELTIFGHKVRFGITAVAMDLAYAWMVFKAGSPLWYIATFVVVLHISILIHELGHAVAFRALGCKHAEVGLHALGGHTMPCDEDGKRLRQQPWRMLVIYAAGPAVGLLLSGISFLAATMATTEVMLVATTQGFLIGLVLNLSNLLPVFPLDGGGMVKSLMEGLLPKRVSQVAVMLLCLMSAGVAVGLGYLGFETMDPLMGVSACFMFAGNVFTIMDTLFDLRSRLEESVAVRGAATSP